MKPNSKEFSLIYKLLSLLFLPPSLHNEQELVMLTETLKNNIGNEDLKVFCPELIEDLEKTLNLISDSEILDQYKTDLTSTLITSFGKTPCPPYESIYVLPMLKERTIAVPSVINRLRSLYRKMGVEISNIPTLTEDHISTELEFLSLLHASLYVAEKSEIYDNINNIRRQFLQNMMTWIPNFTRCILENASSELLKIQASLLENTIKCDYNNAMMT